MMSNGAAVFAQVERTLRLNCSAPRRNQSGKVYETWRPNINQSVVEYGADFNVLLINRWLMWCAEAGTGGCHQSQQVTKVGTVNFREFLQYFIILFNESMVALVSQDLSGLVRAYKTHRW